MTRPTRQEILSAQPGQQLDAWVAEHVMGWDSAGSYYGECHFKTSEDISFYVPPDDIYDFGGVSSFAPSRDWNDAMMVRDKVMGTDQQIRSFWRLLLDCSGAENYPPGSTLLSRHLLLKNLQPQHICQAALLAVCGGDDTNRETP